MKDCFDNEKISIMLSYTNECGDTLTRSETVNIHDEFPDPMDIVTIAAEGFLRDIGAIHTNTVFFADELTDDEFEAVTDALKVFRSPEGEVEE